MKSNQFKIELYHDGKVGYFYDISENQWYILERNTLKYRRQSQKLLVNSSAFSLIIAIFSVVINRCYILNSNFYLNSILFVGAMISFFVLNSILNNYIKKQEISDCLFTPISLDEVELEDIVVHAIQLVHVLRNISILSFVGATLGLILFLSLSILIGLIVFIFGLLLSTGIVKNLHILRRFKAIKRIEETMKYSERNNFK